MSVELFRYDDRGYTAWLTENACRYVVNIQHSMNRSDASVHETACRGAQARRRAAGHAPALRQGVLFHADRTGRMGFIARRVGHHQGHLPALTLSRRARPYATLEIAESVFTTAHTGTSRAAYRISIRLIPSARCGLQAN